MASSYTTVNVSVDVDKIEVSPNRFEEVRSVIAENAPHITVGIDPELPDGKAWLCGWWKIGNLPASYTKSSVYLKPINAEQERDGGFTLDTEQLAGLKAGKFLSYEAVCFHVTQSVWPFTEYRAFIHM